MPTTLFYDDNCNSLIEYSSNNNNSSSISSHFGSPHFHTVAKYGKESTTTVHQEHSCTLLRALLSSNVTTSNHEMSEMVIERQIEAFEFAESMKPEARRGTGLAIESLIPRYRTILSAWEWDVRGRDLHRHLLSARGDERLVAVHPLCAVNGACFETYGVRGTQSLKRNALTYWEMRIVASRGATSLMVGVGTERAKLQSLGYVNLLGADTNSWALSLTTGQTWHNNCAIGTVDCSMLASGGEATATTSTTTIVIGCLFDGYVGRLMFFKDGHSLGASSILRDLPIDEPLFPIVSSTSANTQFRIERAYESMVNLHELCRRELAAFNNSIS